MSIEDKPPIITEDMPAKVTESPENTTNKAEDGTTKPRKKWTKKNKRRNDRGVPIMCIYKIEGHDKIYIGSTKDFKTRRSNHKSNCRNNPCYSPAPVHRFIMQNGGFNDFKMEVVEILPENTDRTNRRLKEYEKLKELIESFEDLRAGFDRVLNKHLPIIRVRPTEGNL